MEDGRPHPVDAARYANEETLAAVRRVDAAVEWIEGAFGALLDAHHEVEHAEGLVLEAADALRAAGHDDLADRARDEVAPLGAVAARWTDQVIDELGAHLLKPVRAFDADVRERLAGVPVTAHVQSGGGAPARTRSEPRE